MLWDQYCKALDRRLAKQGEDPQLLEAQREAREAAVFDCGTLDLSQAIDGPEHPDKFFVPFEHTCVEWKAVRGDVVEGRVLALFGHSPDSNEDLRGESWHWMVAQQDVRAPNSLRIVKGFVRWRGDDSDAKLVAQLYSVCAYEVRSGDCTASWCADPAVQGQSGSLPERAEREFANLLGNIARAAARAIEQANSPANWIVRVEDERARVVKRRGRKRAEQRVRYIVVPDRDLDRTLRLPNEESDHIERAPHRRRAHYRRLSSPRFRLKRGQRVLVRASYVGPREASYGGERYTVLTELPSYEEA
jgi:hypothetical protein